MLPNPPETADLVTFTEEILIGKLHLLCSVIFHVLIADFKKFGKHMKYTKTLFSMRAFYLAEFNTDIFTTGIFQELSALSESFFKFSTESNLNRFFIFSNEKFFVCF